MPNRLQEEPGTESLRVRMQQRLAERERDSALRDVQNPGALIDLSSNDYLGLSASARLSALVAEQAADIRASGAGASRLLGGNFPMLSHLEDYAAAFHRAEAALFFPSGYAAQSGLISTLARRGDTLLYDELVHASAHEGMRLSPAKRYSFAHNDLHSLRERAKDCSGQVFVLIESIYSMDGDLAPLREIADNCSEYGWNLLVDEAHAGGLAGHRGEGLVAALGLEEQVFARLITYGKAFGSAGGMVLGTALLRRYLINYCRPLIYSTGPLPLQVLMIREAYGLVEKASEERTRIRELRRLLLRDLPRQFGAHESAEADSPSAIVPIHCPGNQAVVALSAALAHRGFDVRAVRSPSVPEGAERLRCCLHAFNTAAEISRFIRALKEEVQPSATS